MNIHEYLNNYMNIHQYLNNYISYEHTLVPT